MKCILGVPKLSTSSITLNVLEFTWVFLWHVQSTFTKLFIKFQTGEEKEGSTDLVNLLASFSCSKVMMVHKSFYITKIFLKNNFCMEQYLCMFSVIIHACIVIVDYLCWIVFGSNLQRSLI